MEQEKKEMVQPSEMVKINEKSNSNQKSSSSGGRPDQFLFNKQFPHIKDASAAWREFYQAVNKAVK